MATHSIGPELLLVEEAPSHHFLAEGHHVCRVSQAPVLVGPELACAAPSCLDLIHQEGTAVLAEMGEKEQINTHHVDQHSTSQRRTAFWSVNQAPRSWAKQVHWSWTGTCPQTAELEQDRNIEYALNLLPATPGSASGPKAPLLPPRAGGYQQRGPVLPPKLQLTCLPVPLTSPTAGYCVRV